MQFGGIDIGIPHTFSRNDETRISRNPESGKSRNPESTILQSDLVSSLGPRRKRTLPPGDDLEHPKPLDPESGETLTSNTGNLETTFS